MTSRQIEGGVLGVLAAAFFINGLLSVIHLFGGPPNDEAAFKGSVLIALAWLVLRGGR